MSQKCCDDCKVHYKVVMGGAPQGAMRVASQIWQVVFASQTLQVFCLAFRKKAQYVVVASTLIALIIASTCVSHSFSLTLIFFHNMFSY